MQTLFAFALLAQVVGMPGARAYTTADPVDPSRLGLATETGRYAIRVSVDCPLTFTPGENVLLAGDGRIEDGAGDVLLSDGITACSLIEATLMDQTPCFNGPDGQCDINAEADG